jgi:TRAP transporter TAXI family solute receptor
MTMLMLQGKSQLATNNSPNAGYILKNAAPWPADANKVYRGLTFGGYESQNQWMVRADSPIKTFADLKGKKGMVDRQGEPAFADVWPAVLAAYGVDKKDFTATPDLNIASQATALKENRTDIIMFYGAAPVPNIVELTQSTPVRLVSHTPEGIKKVLSSLPWVANPHTIKAGTYKGQDADAIELKFFLGVGVRSDVPESLVYQMAKAIDEHIDELKATHASFKTWTIQDLANSPYGPYHAGAYKYYTEKGYLTQESIDKHKEFLKQIGMDK